MSWLISPRSSGTASTAACLNADPTTQYGLESRASGGRLNPDPNTVEHPYNTYKFAGMLPGPIANPGLDALRATVYPRRITTCTLSRRTTAATLTFLPRRLRSTSGTACSTATAKLHALRTQKYSKPRDRGAHCSRRGGISNFRPGFYRLAGRAASVKVTSRSESEPGVTIVRATVSPTVCFSSSSTSELSSFISTPSNLVMMVSAHARVSGGASGLDLCHQDTGVVRKVVVSGDLGRD